MEIAKEILKKHILSIICGVIMLIALIALVWPVSGWYDEFAVQLQARKKVNDDLSRLRTAQRNWPVIPDVSKPAQSKLDLFPNAERIAEGDYIKKRVHEQAISMEELTAKPNVHDQLVPGLLPSPSERRFDFLGSYQKMMQQTLPADLQAAVPPTEADIQAEAARMWTGEYASKILKIGGKEVNLATEITEWTAAANKLPVSMRVDRAHSCKIYLDPSALAFHKAMVNSPQGPKEAEIWYAQSMLWVEQDVLSAIKRLNQSAKDVTDSPVKQIIRFDVPEDQTIYVKDASLSPAGRVSNDLYDVLQFTLILNVDAQQIPKVVAELQKGKLITVNQFNVIAVDGLAAAEDGYIYGDVPVVTLTIKGEDLFLRDWTTKLMPEPIKLALGVAK